MTSKIFPQWGPDLPHLYNKSPSLSHVCRTHIKLGILTGFSESLLYPRRTVKPQILLVQSRLVPDRTDVQTALICQRANRLFFWLCNATANTLLKIFKEHCVFCHWSQYKCTHSPTHSKSLINEAKTCLSCDKLVTDQGWCFLIKMKSSLSRNVHRMLCVKVEFC